MLNTNKHHSKSYTSHRQSDTPIEQNLPTQRHVRTDPRTAITIAASLRSLPLAVERLDTSRDPARQPAQPKAVWHNHPTHRQPNLIWKQETRSNALRPDTGARPQTSGRTSGRGVTQYPDKSQASEGLMERPRCGVRQDNDRFFSDRGASLQPAADNKITRSQATSRLSARSQKVDHHDNRRTVPIQVWVRPLVKETLTRLARQEGLSLSASGGALLERALQQNIDLEYSALLQPVIEHAIAKQMRGISTRLAWLLVRVSIDSGQTRSLVTNILGRQQGMTTDLLRSIVKQSAQTARGNICRRTPQLEDVIQSVEKWILTDDKEVLRDRGQSN